MKSKENINKNPEQKPGPKSDGFDGRPPRDIEDEFKQQTEIYLQSNKYIQIPNPRGDGKLILPISQSGTLNFSQPVVYYGSEGNREQVKKYVDSLWEHADRREKYKAICEWWLGFALFSKKKSQYQFVIYPDEKTPTSIAVYDIKDLMSDNLKIVAFATDADTVGVYKEMKNDGLDPTIISDVQKFFSKKIKK